MQSYQKKWVLIISVLVIGVGVYLAVSHMKKSNYLPVTGMQRSEIAGSQAFNSAQYKDLDELIASSDHVMFGTVVEVSELDRHTDEYTVQVVDQYKGDVHSRNIYVYESANKLEIGKSYVLFLEMIFQSYVDHPVYTSGNKESILQVVEDEIKHHSPLLDQNMTLKQLQHVLLSSPGKTKIATTDYTRGHATIVQDELSLEQLIEASHLIAKVIPEAFLLENKYNKLGKFKWIETYHNTSGIEITDQTLFIMPAELELDKEYVVFLQYHDGAFYTVSRKGSLISSDDKEKWLQTLDIVKEIGS